MNHSLSRIISVLGCRVVGNPSKDSEISELLFDSRSLVDAPSTLFCALHTKSADGHRYIPSLYRRGVRAFLVEDGDNLDFRQFLPHGAGDAVFLVVPDVAEAIERLAASWRQSLRGKVVGITGSAGKTVVKEMIYKALTADGIKASRSPRSWNSRLGAPLSLLEAAPDDEVVVLEAGIDTVGDMASHAATIRPEIGILTAITAAHDGGFESRREKIREKIKLFVDSHTIIYDASSPEVDDILREAFPDKRLVPVKGRDACDTDRSLAAAAINEIKSQSSLPTLDDVDAVTNRIDVHEGVNDCVMLYDDFTNDLRSLHWALDFMHRRIADGRTATLILSDLFHAPMTPGEEAVLYSRLGRLLENFGVGRLIAIGPELSRNRASIPAGIAVENVASVSEFLEHYDINRFSSEIILISGAPQKEFKEIKNALESPRHDTILEINLDALVHNFNYYRSKLRPSTGMAAMIKASAYGAGAVEVAKTLQAQGTSYLAVAVIDEGIELRRGGITMPIMVLNPVTTNYRALFRHRLEPSVFSLRELDILVSEARKAGVDNFAAHIKLDTGMHRVGFTEQEIPDLIERIKATPELRVASVFSHLATADCPDEDAYTRMQLETFGRASGAIIDALPYPVIRHILNTAGIMTHPEHQYDMVRLGIGLYGISPLEDGTAHKSLRPVATLRSTIISIKRWNAGTTIGYGRRGLLTRDSVIATLPIGYADGLDRHLSRGAARFLVRGVECPTVGNICMDQCMIDITDVPGAAIGDDVEIFGENMPVERVARILDTIPYEVLTSVSPRVRRIYFRD